MYRWALPWNQQAAHIEPGDAKPGEPRPGAASDSRARHNNAAGGQSEADRARTDRTEAPKADGSEVRGHAKDQPIVGGAGKSQGVAPPGSRPEGAKTATYPEMGDAADTHDPTQPPFVLDALTLSKRAWLNPFFFIFRVLLYFTVWTVIARWYWRQSVLQDQTGDPEITVRMQRFSPISLVLTAVTLTTGAFDLFMSLDPHWFSTMFGVYYFAGAFLATFAALIVLATLLQRHGYLRRSITTEHYHDLGKWLFAFVFFWGYIAFSQYMLLWYANIPEETEWFSRHGATTVRADMSGWTWVALVILFCHLLIPFGGLLSRHVKRKKGSLVFWAVWILVFHYVDMYWVILPEMGGGFSPSLIDLTALAGVGGVFVAAMIKIASKHDLVPVADPRLDQALAFQNI